METAITALRVRIDHYILHRGDTHIAEQRIRLGVHCAVLGGSDFEEFL
jgi:hypothetical protein